MFKQKQITESGIVRYINGNRAAIEIVRPNSEECKSCGVCAGIENKPYLLEAEITPNIYVGQQVTVQVAEGSPYKSMIFLFVLPILNLLIGSLIGQKIHCIFPNSQDIRMVFCGFIFFIVTIIVVSIYDRKLRSRKSSRRAIISVDTQNSFNPIAR